MEIPDHKTPTQLYDHETLETFFEDIASPQEIARHLDQLLYFLVYSSTKKVCRGFTRYTATSSSLKGYYKQ